MTTPLRTRARRVAELSNQVVHAAREAGRDDLADVLTGAAARWTEGEVVVLVVGEARAGTSSLIGALVGREGPVLPDAPPDVPVVVRTGEIDEVEIWIDGLDEPFRTSGPGPLAGADLPGAVASIEVTVAGAATGADLVLIDAPHLGGPRPAVDAVTAATLPACDALLFVTDATAVLGAGELAFLERAAEHVGAIRVVCSRTDATRAAATVVADTERRLSAVLPGVEVTGTSTALWSEAARLGARGVPEATEIAVESGIPAVRRWLSENLLAGRRTVRLRALLAGGRRVAAQLADEAETSATAARISSEDLRRTLESTQAALREVREQSAASSTALTDGLHVLRERAAVETTRRCNDARDHLDLAVLARRGEDEVLAEAEERAVHTRLELQAWLNAQLSDLASEVGRLAPSVEPQLVAAFERRRGQQERADSSVRLRLGAAAASGGGGLLMATSMAGTARMPFMVAAAVLGGVAAVVNVRSGTLQRDVQELRAVVRSSIDEWRTQLHAEVRTLLLTAQRDLEQALRTDVRDRVATLEARIEHQRSLLRVAESERADRAAQADRRRGALVAILAEIDEVLAELRHEAVAA